MIFFSFAETCLTCIIHCSPSSLPSFLPLTLSWHGDALRLHLKCLHTIECCRDDIFLEANPKVRLAVVPLIKSQRDFPIFPVSRWVSVLGMMSHFIATAFLKTHKSLKIPEWNIYWCISCCCKSPKLESATMLTHFWVLKGVFKTVSHDL